MAMEPALVGRALAIGLFAALAVIPSRGIAEERVSYKWAHSNGTSGSLGEGSSQNETQFFRNWRDPAGVDYRLSTQAGAWLVDWGTGPWLTGSLFAGVNSGVANPATRISGEMSARIGDVVTFSIPGASATTVTPVTFAWLMSGVWQSPDPHPTEATSIALTSTLSGDSTSHATVKWIVDPSDGFGNILVRAPTELTGATGGPATRVNPGNGRLMAGYEFAHTITLLGATPRLSFETELATELTLAGSSFRYAFGNALLELEGLPTGTTFVSESGKFFERQPPPPLPAIPEPGGLLFVAAGLAAVWLKFRSRAPGQ